MGSVVIPKGLKRKEVWLDKKTLAALEKQAKRKRKKLKAHLQDICIEAAEAK